jgi:hypothetical protein
MCEQQKQPQGGSTSSWALRLLALVLTCSCTCTCRRTPKNLAAAAAADWPCPATVGIPGAWNSGSKAGLLAGTSVGVPSPSTENETHSTAADAAVVSDE